MGRWPDTKLNLKNQEVNEFLTVLKTLDITVFSLMLLPMSRPQGLPGIPSETTYVAACITTGGVPKGPGSREEPGGTRNDEEPRGGAIWKTGHPIFWGHLAGPRALLGSQERHH